MLLRWLTSWAVEEGERREERIKGRGEGGGGRERGREGEEGGRERKSEGGKEGGREERREGGRRSVCRGSPLKAVSRQT